MEELRKHFITTERPYKEGTVEVFQQIINEKEIKKASLYITALGVYDVLIDGKKANMTLKFWLNLNSIVIFHTKFCHIWKRITKMFSNPSWNI